MRVNFRQGIVGHQPAPFLQINGGGHVDIFASTRPLTLTIAHRDADYTHSEDNTVVNAWIGPFNPSTDYWLYLDFNPLTFARTFNKTIIEPVAQSAEPGIGNALITAVTAGVSGVGSFTVPENYVLEVGRSFDVAGSTGNNGTYTVQLATFSGITGNTIITVDETIPDSTVDGSLTLDVDSSGAPLLVDGRHWYDTATDIHYVRSGGGWTEVIRIFIAQVVNGNTFISQSINGPIFTGTQIGNVSSVLSGRVLFDGTGDPIIRDDRTFFTTEDQFFSNQSRVDGIRLESNVAKAQSADPTMGAFTVVAYTGDGIISTGQYGDTSTTVLGLLTEGISFGEIGSVVIQGVVTNPAWNWLGTGTVGADLWVENGLLVLIDPHVSNPIANPQGKVPVARVLSNDTVVFEQGLGGKGDRGPVGTIAQLPPATTSEIGGVTLLTASSDSLNALVISDTDVRLTDARNPLSHTHQANNITVTPGSGISSIDGQSAFEELAVEKLNVAGGSMTGPLTLLSNPVNILEAVTKQYVDNLISGLIWLDPIEIVNLISDIITTPPGSPEPGDTYIMAVGPTGAWSGFAVGNVVAWNNDTSMWVDHGPVGNLHSVGTRLGIAMLSSTVPSGSLTGRKNEIVIYDIAGNLISFEVPVNNNAVYVNHVDSVSAFNQYAFDGTSWVLFSSGQNLTVDGTTLQVSANVLSVIPFSTGGEVDAKFWQGLVPTDLDSTYATLVHNHTGSSINLTAYNTSPDWGTLLDTSDEITASQVQVALQDITDNKASKTPSYATQAGRPTAANVDGMIVYVVDIERLYVASNGAWIPVLKDNDTIRLPYDMSYFFTGPIQTNILVGSFVATRPVTVKAGAPGSLSFAEVTATDGTYTFDIVHRPAPTFTPAVVGTLAFAIGSSTGTFVWAVDTSIVAGDLLQIRTDTTAAPDSTLDGVTATIVGCAPTTQCTI